MNDQTQQIVELLQQFAMTLGLDEQDAGQAAVGFLQKIQGPDAVPSQKNGGPISFHKCGGQVKKAKKGTKTQASEGLDMTPIYTNRNLIPFVNQNFPRSYDDVFYALTPSSDSQRNYWVSKVSMPGINVPTAHLPYNEYDAMSYQNFPGLGVLQTPQNYKRVYEIDGKFTTKK